MSDARPLLESPAATVWRAHHLTLAEALRERGEMVDAVIVDAPYSDRTHAGHDGGVGEQLKADQGNDGRRRRLQYGCWGESEVAEFVAAWAPLCRGWIVSLTDDILFPAWKRALADAGLTTFQDVPAVITGMTVRLAGDGPSSWAIHCAVARPKRLHRWGTLPGAYVLPAARQPVVGGKPFDLMRALVRDYTRPGDLVADPCCGAGTTLVAARAEGRRAIGGDVDEKHARMAARWLQGLAPVADDKQLEIATTQ